MDEAGGRGEGENSIPVFNLSISGILQVGDFSFFEGGREI
jgi:hypothetical protein